MKENLQFDSELLEEMILVGSIHIRSFFLKVKQYLHTKSKKKSYFKDVKNQMIFNMVCLWYDKFEKMPSERELLLLIQRTTEDQEIKDLLSAMVIRFSSQDPKEINLEFLLEESQKFITEARVYEAMLMSQQYLADGSFSAIVDSMREATNVSFDKDLGLSIKDIEGITKEFEGLGGGEGTPTGLSTLDALLGGGIKRKELMVVASTAGLFKTGFMGCIGVHNFLLGKKVLMYTFETSKARLMSRFIQNIANMTKTEILSGEDFKEKLDRQNDTTDGDIIIKEYESNSVSSNDIAAHIEELDKQKNWKPDLIILDYLLIMKANDPRLDPSNSYKYYKTVAEEVRNLGVRYEVPVISAIQINREGMGEGGGSKNITTSKNIAESAGVFHTADYFLTLNQTSKDKEQSKLMIFLEKNRNDEGHKKIFTEIDYEHMRMAEVMR